MFITSRLRNFDIPGDVMSVLKWALVFVVVFLVSGPICPAAVTFKAMGSNSDGALSATVDFTAITDGIKISITNNAAGEIKKGQAISYLAFDLDGIGPATKFTRLMGRLLDSTSDIGSDNTWVLTDGAMFTHTSAAPPINSIDHWGFK